jgi:hypothetical protein
MLVSFDGEKSTPCNFVSFSDQQPYITCLCYEYRASWARCMSLAVRPWHTGCRLCLVALLHLSLFFRFVVLNNTGSTDNTDNIGSTD